jgi:hypothetical protein
MALGVAGASIAALVVPVVTATPAAAHDVSATYWTGSPPVLFGRARGRVYSSHTRVEACDLAADNVGTRTWYWTTNGVLDYVGDANGSASPCYSEAPAGGGTITHFQVCWGDNCLGRMPA